VITCIEIAAAPLPIVEVRKSLVFEPIIARAFTVALLLGGIRSVIWPVVADSAIC
jgi:hypothetical protein